MYISIPKSIDPQQMDITAPIGDVEIQVRSNGSVIWIHCEGITVLRICRIEGDIIINDDRR